MIIYINDYLQYNNNNNNSKRFDPKLILLKMLIEISFLLFYANECCIIATWSSLLCTSHEEL